VIAPDYPGSGIPVTLDDLADAVVHAAVAAGVQNFTIVGFSLGAAVAIRASTRHPGRVDGLILAAGFARADNRARLAIDIWQDMLRLERRETFMRFSLFSALSASFANSSPPEQIYYRTVGRTATSMTWPSGWPSRRTAPSRTPTPVAAPRTPRTR